jgi:hypothetical protein
MLLEPKGTFLLKPFAFRRLSVMNNLPLPNRDKEPERTDMNTKTQSFVEANTPSGKNNKNNAPIMGSASNKTETVDDGRRIGRRSFVKGLALGGASLLSITTALADPARNKTGLGSIADSDAAILRFLAAAEILETDLWQQYTAFADLDSPYADALEAIDDDMPPYIEQNTADEFSHQNFLNAFLVKMHKQPVNLEPFRTLPSSPVAPSKPAVSPT